MVSIPKSDEARVRALIARVARRDVSHVPLDADLADETGLDSLDCLTVLGGLEEAFAIRFADERLQLPRTLRGVLAMVAAAREEDRCASA